MLFKLLNKTLNSKAIGEHTHTHKDMIPTFVFVQLPWREHLCFLNSVPWLSGGTGSVFSVMSNGDSFQNPFSVPDGSYVPKGPRLFLEIVTCVQGILEYFLSLKCLLPFLETAKSSMSVMIYTYSSENYSKTLRHKSLSIPSDQSSRPKRSNHILWLCLLKKRQRGNIILFSQAICSPG